MVKKKIKKNIVKTKSLGFKIPESFNALNFNQKIISVALIVLIIGVVANIFLGDNVTGMATGFQNVFEPLKGLLSGVNDLITTIFRAFFPGETDLLIIYARFILFALVIGIIYFLMNIIGSTNALVNILAGVAIAYLSTFFVPFDVILATGILYSTTFMSLMIFIPFILLILIYAKLPKTKTGYILRVLISLIMIIIINQNAVSSNTAYWLLNIMSILNIGAIIAFGYAFVRIFIVKAGEEAEGKAIKGVALALKTRIDQLLAKSARKQS